LTLKPETVDFSRWENPVCVYSSRYEETDSIPAVPFNEFKENPRAEVESYETLIFLGLTDAMTPSNRTDEVWEFLFNQIDKTCVSVDRFLFKSDPWRSWFHFGLIDAEYRDYTYSYLAENDYKHFFNGETEDNPFSLEEIKKWGEDVIESHYPEYFKQFEIEVGYEASPAEEYEYSERLDELFGAKNTVGQVRRGLESYCDKIYPDRDMPKRHQIFRGSREWRLKRTDLPVDRWKASRLQNLVELTNSVLGEFYVKS
jgi:hypothetical protein